MLDELKSRRKEAEKICFDFFNVAKVVKRSKIHINDEEYNKLVKLTNYVTDSSLIKHQGLRELPWLAKTPQNTMSDQKLAAAALYKSLIDNTAVTVVTHDHDIERILHNSCNYLMQDDKFTNALIKNPVSVIMINTEKDFMNKAFDSRHVDKIKTTAYLRDPLQIMKPPKLQVLDYRVVNCPGAYLFNAA